MIIDQSFYHFSQLLSQSSAKIIQQYFRSNIHIELKEDHSPVTIADRKAEEIMRSLIMKEYPDHGIFGEEFGSYRPDAEYVWVLDPIDGTKSFIAGIPLFGTLIALLKNGIPILGVINDPVAGQFLIGDNQQTLLNNNPVKLRECTDLNQALLLTTDHLNVHKYQKGNNFEELIRQVKLYRTWGDCYGYYLLATGNADIMIDPVMSKWDSMAVIPIIKGAGGTISSYQGEDPVQHYTSIIASSNRIHERVIQLLNK